MASERALGEGARRVAAEGECRAVRPFRIRPRHFDLRAWLALWGCTLQQPIGSRRPHHLRIQLSLWLDRLAITSPRLIRRVFLPLCWPSLSVHWLPHPFSARCLVVTQRDPFSKRSATMKQRNALKKSRLAPLPRSLSVGLTISERDASHYVALLAKSTDMAPSLHAAAEAQGLSAAATRGRIAS